MIKKLKKPELMAPVSDLVSLKTAILSGADSVYFGLKTLNMRAKAKNFEENQLKKVVEFCHENNTKAYLTLNTIIFDDELEKLESIIQIAKQANIDAIICWDFAVIQLLQKYKIPIILSTQASISNVLSAKYFENQGIKRIVLARECSLEQIKNIKKETNLEIEIFIHGAMCVSYSGRCFLSQFLYNKSANRGECIQPCRRQYIVRDIEEDTELELGNNYILSPKDLCTIDFIEELIESGVDCFKIEGRKRSPEYIQTVTSVYRKAIDKYFVDKNLTKDFKKGLKEDLSKVFNRDFSDGFFLNKDTKEWAKEWTHDYGSKATQKKIFIGFVKNYYSRIGVAEIDIKSNNISTGDQLMFQGNKTGVITEKINSIESNHKKVKSAKSGDWIAIKTKNLVRKNDKVFKVTYSSSA
jgi:U32 family peptidase